MGNKYDFQITKLKIKGHESPCLLFECGHDENLKKECTEKGYTVYEVRHLENNWADPYTIERDVLVNFWGYIAFKDIKGIDLLNKKIDEDGAFRVTTCSLDRFSEDTSTRYDSIVPDEFTELTTLV